MSGEKKPCQLPEGWIKVKIGNLAHFINGKTFHSKDWKTSGIPIIRIQNLNNTESTYNYINSNNYVEEKYHVKNGDLLFAWSGTPGTSFGAHIWNGSTAYLNQHIFKVVVFDGIDQRFFFYTLSYKVNYFVEKSKGTAGLSHITKKELEDTECFLPPYSEQIRIVNKIEELFSELDKSIEDLEKSKRQLKAYHQTLLNDAFDGNLTKKWRENHNTEKAESILNRLRTERQSMYYQENKKTKLQIEKTKYSDNFSKEDFSYILPILPSKWKWIKLGEIEELIGSGITPKGGSNVYKDMGIPFIRSQNIYPSKMVLDNVAFIDQNTHNKMIRTQLKPKDVLLNITGASIGRCAFVPETFSAGNINQHVCIIRSFTDEVNYKYICAYLNSPIAQKIIQLINSGATREALTQNQIRNFPFPLTSNTEQLEIINSIDSKWTLAENLISVIDTYCKKLYALKTSILKQAFEGKLTEQHKTESVSDLLKKITSEKEKYFLAEKLNRQTIKKPKMDPEKKTIIDILKEKKSPVLAKELWESSIYQGDIEAFYAELKRLIESGKVQELPREGKESFITLKK